MSVRRTKIQERISFSKCRIFFFVIMMGVTIVIMPKPEVWKYSLEESFQKPFLDLIKRSNSISQEDPTLIETIRREFLKEPSKKAYNLQHPEIQDPSQWQVAEIQKLLKNKTNGFFIESGAFEGEYFSNSLYFERFLGWHGILIEPYPEHYNLLLSKNRKSYKARACLSPTKHSSKVPFRKEGWASTIAKDIKQVEEADFITVQCFPIFSFLLAMNVTKIDYFSLDVEGVEFDVLKTIPWDRVNITTISAEIQFLGDKKKDLVEYMQNLGYVNLTTYIQQHVPYRIDYIFYHPKLL